MFRRIPLFLFFCMCTVPAYGYVPQVDWNDRGQIVAMQWSASRAREGIPFHVNTGSFPFSEQDVVRITQNGFSRWADVPTAAIQFENRGTGQYLASTTDRRNVIVYDDDGRFLSAPAGSGVIAITRVNWTQQGELLDADIIFNGRDFRFSISENSTPREQVDLEDVLTHEVGHFLGLDHTPLVGPPHLRPTMNPFNTSEAPREGRSLELDDVAGVTALYPSAQASEMGRITGRVIHHDGSGTLGVHVVAYRADTETFVASALSGSAGAKKGRDGDGEYEIAGLPPGDYHVAIEPLNGSITHENFGGIFNERFNTGFDREFYDNASLQQTAQRVRVSAGRVAEGVDFALGIAILGAPFIQDLVLPVNTPDAGGPYRVEARITDDNGVTSAELIYRINGGRQQTLSLERTSGDRFFADIPGQNQGTVVEYRLVARDADGHETAVPAQDVPMLQFEVFSFSGAPVAYVALRRSGVVSVFDTGPGREVARIPVGETPLSLALTPDEQYLFVANTGSEQNTSDNRVMVIETATHRVAATIRVGSAPLDLAMSPDGRRVYVTNSQSRSVSVLDVASLREVSRRIQAPTSGEGPYGIAVSPDGERLYVTDIDASQVLVLDVTQNQVLQRINVVGSPRSLALSADGKRLYVAGFEGDLSVVDTEAGTAVKRIDTGAAGVFRVALSPEGQRLYATDRVNARLLVMDLATDRILTRVPALLNGRETRDLFVSANGSPVYVTNQDSNDLILFDAGTLTVARSFALGDGPRGIVVRQRPVPQQYSLEDVKQADFDDSGQVDFSDFLLFVGVFGRVASDSGFDARFDLDRDDRVNFGDFLIFAGVFGRASNP